ncbi:MAG: transposase, partial [Microcystis aeruginosa BK11-02]|nr:transposase [Microcystis aeruginosa BK11-02]NCS79403.1 transposase [Microcystis aeruginosa K13-07]
MKETTPAAMPPCFDRWCGRFDNCFKNEAQKNGFRQYLGGLLGESERKNLTQMANNAFGVIYNRLHHFLTESPWSDRQVNECRLQVMNQCCQTQIRRGFSLIVDDSGHRTASSLKEGKEDKEFQKKPEIAIDLIDRSLTRGYRPKIV